MIAIRYPKGSECQCDACGVFFSCESAFNKHWTKDGHKHAREVGLVERMGARGSVWGWPAAEEGSWRNLSGLSAGQERPGTGARHSDSGGAGNGAPTPAQSLSGITGDPSSPTVGARGPGGGLYAKCEACGQVWEREKRRGRPVTKCEECRK